MDGIESTRWLTNREARALLGVSHQTIRNLARRGVITSLEVQGLSKTRYLASDVEAILANGIRPRTQPIAVRELEPVGA